MNKKRIAIIVLSLILSLGLVGCKEEKEYTYNTNEDFFTDERIDWYSSADWGSSIDGSMIRVGEYEISADTIQLVKAKAAPASFDQIFFNQVGKLSNYTVSADFTIDAIIEQEGVYNKVGFYAAYKDEQNYAWVILHPIEDEQFISVTTMVNGAWVDVWKIYSVEGGIDTTAVQSLEVIKLGSEFRMYLNDALIGAFHADIDEAQVGFLSEEATYTANNFVFEEATTFPIFLSNWGDAIDSGITMSGSYDVVINDLVLTGDASESSIFKQDETVFDYTLQSDILIESLGTGSFAGYYVSYVDNQNYSKIYFDVDSSSLIVTEVVAGVETTNSTIVADVVVTDPINLSVYKLGTEGKVYVDGTFVTTFTAPDSETSFGLYSNNADVSYSTLSSSVITAFPSELWGGSFDGVIPQKGITEIIEDDVTLLTTAGGAYGEFETVFYLGEDALSTFSVQSDMYLGTDVEVDGNSKFGFLLYNSIEYYLEIFIIPESNAIYTVGKSNNEFLFADEGFWHNGYTFEEGHDFKSATTLKVEKIEGVFNIYADGVLQFTLNLPEFAELDMQVALTAEKTAPVHFDNFIIETVSEADKAPVVTDLYLTKSFEVGSTSPDFTTYVEATDNIDGAITITAGMVDITNVDMDAVGTFDVIYTVTDSDSNITTYTISIIITAAPTVYWGDSYDDLVATNGLFTGDENGATIVSTNNGGYGSMEQVFYNGISPLVNFTTEADIRMDSAIVVDDNNKYGFMLYNSPTNYLEVFVIPNLNGIFTVSQVDGAFDRLWTLEYTFADGFDFTTANNYRVEKVGANISVYVDEVVVFTYIQPVYETLEMQVALVGEKTAPVYFENFTYASVEEDTIAPTFDAITDQTVEAGIADIDFTTLILNAADNSGSALQKVEVEDNVLYDTLGTYTVTVKLVDAFGNELSQTFNVTVEDTTGPTFDVIADQTIIIGGTDTDWTTFITNATDNVTGILTNVEVEDNVLYDTIGTYTVIVKVTDVIGNETTQTFNVEVVSQPNPNLSVVGNETTFNIGSTAPDFTTYITANDEVDGVITITSGMVDVTNVDMNTLGTFDVVYTVTDADSYSTTVTITFTIQNVWGDSYDTLLVTNGLFTGDHTGATITSTNNGGYGSMEQVFYTGTTPLVDFTTEADIRMDSSVVVDANTKYGLMIYNSPTNYLEIFIIPSLNGIFTVSQVNGGFDRLWTAEYTFADGFDFTTANNIKVEKFGATIYVYVDDVVAFTYTQAAYETLEMQVALVGEKTAPVYFENFSYTALVAEAVAPTFDTIVDQTIEAGVANIDFTTLIMNAADDSNSALIKVEVEDNVIYDTLGTYSVTVKVLDIFGNETSQSFDVTVEDTTNPTFDTIADQTVVIDGADIDWTTYIQNAADNAAGTLTNVEVTDDVLYDTVGTYTVTVKVTDASGNETSQTFNVEVLSQPNPILTLVGNEVVFELGNPAPDFTTYITADDAVDGVITITSGMVDVTNVDMNTVGTFDVIYTVVDADLNSSTLTITFTIQDVWGDSYDALITSNGLYSVTGKNVSITSTANGGYGAMEQVYYNGTAPLANLITEADIRIDSSVIVDVNTKYGFMLYHNATNYLEIYILPSTNQILTVAQVAGGWDRLWTLEYTIDPAFDFTTSNNFRVEKVGAVITVFLDDVEIFTYTQAAFETLAMQVALIGEKTAPVYFDNFEYSFNPAANWGDSYDDAIVSNGFYSVTTENVTITSTAGGGYGSMEQVYYNGSVPLAYFITEADVRMDSSVVVDVNTKYGFLLYHNATNYVEIYILPSSGEILTVSQVGGAFEKLWTLEHTLDPAFDFTTSNNFRVEKVGASITVYLDDVEIFTYTQAAYETLAMQVALIGEKTAPVYFDNFEYSLHPAANWGDSYDDVITSNGLYSVTSTNVTITSTAGGGYGSMEQVYYNGTEPLTDFITEADIRIDSSVVVDVNTKYGFMLYHNATNYVEIYVLPGSGEILTVSQVGGAFEKLWTLEHTLDPAFDFTTSNNFRVEKVGSSITVYLDDVEIFTYTQAAYETLAMQVALIGEKTAPIYFDNFEYAAPIE